MTGQGEISALCRKLERRFGKKAIEERKKAKAIKTGSTRDEAAKAWEDGEFEGKSRKMVEGIDGESIQVTFSLTAHFETAALEVEDLDIGYGDDLAGDVDDGQDVDEPNPDNEALDSDDEDVDAKLGIDKEESEGEYMARLRQDNWRQPF